MADRDIRIPSQLPVWSEEGFVLFPGTMAALVIDEDTAKFASERIARDDGLVAIAVEVESEEAPEGAEEKHGEGTEIEWGPIGVAAKIVRVAKERGGETTMLLEGLARVELGVITQEEPYAIASVSVQPEPKPPYSAKVAALAMEAKKLSREILSMLPNVPNEIGEQIQAMTEPGKLADLLAFRVPAPTEEKRAALEATVLEERLELVVQMLGRRRELLDVSSKIDGAVRAQVGKQEREHMLRGRMRAIQKELNALARQKAGEDPDEDDDEQNGAKVLKKRLDEVELSKEVRAQVEKELKRLASLPQASPEVSVARTWLTWIADLPWGKVTPDNTDVGNAQAQLDKDHNGLEKVKKRIAEYLAVRSLKKDLKGPILCLIGPPGVGKTSLGQSIAKAMGRKFVRVSLGGVRDEAEVRGHRRTYVGALPGRFVQAMKRAGTSNPVMLLDEIDKMGSGAQGDPSAALLEVLDPEQNHAFADHYLEVPLDLSKVLFLATANGFDGIPAPLRDRMEIIEIPSYTVDEKIAIAREHLVPKQAEVHGLSDVTITFTRAALERIVLRHTREAGVRGLERRLAEVCRGLAVERVSGALPTGGAAIERVIDAPEIETLLGPDKILPEAPDRTALPGVAAGLAWTPVGGEVLFVETTSMPGHGKLILTGQLGDVMRESAQAATSYVRAHASELGLPADPLAGLDVHIHLPAGGTPKDGPSAGVTLFTALVSLLTGVRVRDDVAMTGEATLRGRVLPVGGIKEKVLAAIRMGMKRVILPKKCARDLADIPEEALKGLEVVLVERMEEVLAAALVKPLSVTSTAPTDPVPQSPPSAAV
ncbi:MAG: endopeptidase La [Deltaproteobacteria bacterium]|nr:endopeptidase La [Deltaproteobacteria bacterium]